MNSRRFSFTACKISNNTCCEQATVYCDLRVLHPLHRMIQDDPRPSFLEIVQFTLPLSSPQSLTPVLNRLVQSPASMLLTASLPSAAIAYPVFHLPKTTPNLSSEVLVMYL